MKTAIKVLGLCATLSTAVSAFGQITVSTNYSIGSAIPDNNVSGLASVVDFTSAQIFQITDLELTLDISGGFNGDYYAWLSHDSGFSVLLNRVGRDGGNPLGYPDGGLILTLDDQASDGDIHIYRLTLNPGGGPLTGTWSPDGRTDDPDLVTTGSARSAFLSSFNGLDPNGEWTLFIVDLDSGNIGTLQNWGLVVTGLVPEPSTTALVLMGAAALLWRKRRH